MTSVSSSAVASYAILAAVGVTSGVGDVFLYRGAKGGGTGWLLASGALWAASLALLGVFLRGDRFPFGAAIVLATVIHLLVDVAYDLAVHGNRLNGLEWAGIILALVAVALMECGRDHHAAPWPGAEASARDCRES